MKKTAIALLALLMFLTFCSIPAYAETVSTKVEIVSSVSFRDKPSTTSNVMRYLKAGEHATVLSMVDPYWYYIRDLQGVTGYVSASTKYSSIISNAKVISIVNFRSGPSTDAPIIRKLTEGEEIFVLEKVNNYWFKAKDRNGITGYVSSSSNYLLTDFSVTRIVLPLAERIESVINEASKYMGITYEFGSERFDVTTFDCSDFVQQSFWDATRGVLPGDSRLQGDYVKSLGPVTPDWRQLKRGDLMFFMSYNGSDESDYSGINKSTETITHVAIYLGDGKMLHTYSPKSGGVRIDTIDGTPWAYRYLFGGSAMK